jgi:acetyl esterase
VPLDPDIECWLQQHAADRDFTTMTVEEIRNATLLMIGDDDGEEVQLVEEHLVPQGGGPIRVRAYYPVEGDRLPAVMFFHGSGFVICSIETHDALCRSIANRTGAVVFNVDYRLAPEAKFPTAAEDCYVATRWVYEHASELRVDRERMAVAGDSAGGNLAAVTALMARDRGGPPLVFQLLLCPVLDAHMDSPSYEQNASGFGLTRTAMEWYWMHYLSAPEDRDHPYASPLRAPVLSGLPPALVITAEYDPLRDEGEAYAARLRTFGVDAVASRYDGTIHGCYKKRLGFRHADRALDEATDALRRAFGEITSGS